MALKLKPLKNVVESMAEVEIVSGYPTMQLDSKNGWFECPVDSHSGPMFRGLMGDAPIMDFNHKGTISQAYALKTLIVTPLVVAIGYRSDYETDELSEDGKPKSGFVITRERVSGSSSVLRIFGISPQVGREVEGEFKPTPFILTTHGTQTGEILKIMGYRKRNWNEPDVCEASGYEYDLRSGLFFKEIVSNLSLVLDPTGSTIIPQHDWGIPLTFADSAVAVDKKGESFIYKIVKGWGNDDLAYIASLRGQRPKSPLVPKTASPEQREKIMANYNKALTEYNDSVIEQIESSELVRMIPSFSDIVSGLRASIEANKLANVEFDAKMSQTPQYNFLKPVSQLRLPSGCKPLNTLKTYKGDFEKAWESLASEAKMLADTENSISPTFNESPYILSDVALRQMELA